MNVKKKKKSFLTFFEKKGHTIVPSSTLVPDDETLLFTNAGMVPFKKVFLGEEVRPYTRATSVQCCVRAGGKHNDLENVGYTARHHTFFEMLGNFSFGDYFKREAIQFSWEYLTTVLQLPPEKLWVTVYVKDSEAENIWLNEIKIDPNRFSRCGEKDNFWSMGDTGPCGSCTEIFYDHGQTVPGGPPGSPDEEGDRYIEVWNLVFMEYNRDSSGTLTPLPKPSVDTGMGIERLAAVLQGVHNNYEIDLFVHLISCAAKLLSVNDLAQKSLRVIADHIRSTAFLMVDGVIPSNEGRGYVLRRIMRRALRHGNQLGATAPFFWRLVGPLAEIMGEAYPQLRQQQALIEKIILREEEQFQRTLDQGLRILEQAFSNAHDHIVAGETLFKLYDTYGFPVDLTADIARERGFVIDIGGFEREMEVQRQRARQSSQFSVDYSKTSTIDAKTAFTGYHALEGESNIVAIITSAGEAKALAQGESGTIVLAQTPFYAESGGQVGDKGVLRNSNAIFTVQDTKKQGDAVLHHGVMTQGTLAVGELVNAMVDKTLRQATRLNHSATHLLHAALREIVGDHIIQKGSLVEPLRLRFDFAHFEPLTSVQIRAIEKRVNEKILENTEAKTVLMSPEDAMRSGAMALFGEKYGEEVRVLQLGDGYSKELCGGTHVARTGDIGLFKIISEAGIAAGIRRIEALTGEAALEWLSQASDTVAQIAPVLKATRETVEIKITQILEKVRELEKDNQRLKNKLASGVGGDLTSEAIMVGEYKLLVKKLSDTDPTVMRNLMDDLKNKLGRAIIVLATVKDDKVQLIAGVTTNGADKISAGALVNFVAEQVGGKGGGRPDLAQAGGTRPENLDNALASVMGWVQKTLVV